MKELEQKIIWTPGWDRRHENCGNRDMSIEFCLVGSLGAISFNLATKMYPLHLHREWQAAEFNVTSSPACPFVGYHCPVRLSESDAQNDKCELLGDSSCFCCDVGYGEGDRILEIFLRDGIDAMWLELRKLYEKHLVAKILETQFTQTGVGL